MKRSLCTLKTWAILRHIDKLGRGRERGLANCSTYQGGGKGGGKGDVSIVSPKGQKGKGQNFTNVICQKVKVKSHKGQGQNVKGQKVKIKRSKVQRSRSKLKRSRSKVTKVKGQMSKVTKVKGHKRKGQRS